MRAIQLALVTHSQVLTIVATTWMLRSKVIDELAQHNFPGIFAPLHPLHVGLRQVAGDE